MIEIPPLPDGDDVPSQATVADALVRLLPDSAQEAGRLVLESAILPHALRALADFERPRAMVEEVYEELAAELVHSDDPMSTLHNLAIATELDALSDAALALAIARYARDHPSAERTARHWLPDGQARLLELSDDEIAGEAARRLDALRKLEARARADEAIWEQSRVQVVHTRLTFQSARSGSFEAAAGPLGDFLREVGEAPDNLDVH